MKRVLNIIIAAILVIIAALPWIVYSRSLSLVEGRPTPTTTKLSSEELDRVWRENEKYLNKDNLGEITPYWFYKFLVYGLANDSFGIKVTDKQMHAGMSHMAGFVAIWYLRDGHFKGKRMLQWHTADISLEIWIQRQWSPEQLAATYLEYQDRIAKRSNRFVPKRGRNK